MLSPGVSEMFLILILVLMFSLGRGVYKGGEQKDWEMNGIRVHDVNFPKNRFLKLMLK